VDDGGLALLRDMAQLVIREMNAPQ